ncbi:uncharacterized protein TNCT_545021 [Trichonephila clavata]|uniref:Uncharacterized protein n=1 Tax=Trichonephila clavata TaxID=2740835 RepID=A0A8X6G682_TRICU|nr:uncharacterized protein TNCT_545021 [Trichonephila clavata]
MDYVFPDPVSLVTLENITALDEEMLYVTQMRNLIYFRIVDAWNSKRKYFHQILLKMEDLVFFLACFKSAMIQQANSSVDASNSKLFRHLKALSGIKKVVDIPDFCGLHYHANSLTKCYGTLGCIDLYHLFSTDRGITASQIFKWTTEGQRKCNVPFVSNFSMLFIFELHENWTSCTGHEINFMKCKNISLNEDYHPDHASQNEESRYFWHRMFDDEAYLFSANLKYITSFVRDMQKLSKLKRVNVFEQIWKRERGETFNELMVLDSIVSPYYYLLPYQNKSEYEQFKCWSFWKSHKDASDYIKILFATFPLKICRHEVLRVPAQF